MKKYTFNNIHNDVKYSIEFIPSNSYHNDKLLLFDEFYIIQDVDYLDKRVDISEVIDNMQIRWNAKIDVKIEKLKDTIKFVSSELDTVKEG